MTLLARLAPALALATLAACASTPAPSRPTPPVPSGPTVQPSFQLTPSTFADVPGWREADLAPALAAFRRHCAVWTRRAPVEPVGQGRHGGISDWLPACANAGSVQPGGERAFFEAFFAPQAVAGQGEARLTAYYEPIVEAARAPSGLITEPLLRRPDDMVTIDLGAFAEAYDNETLRGAPRTLTGKLEGNRVRPYPERGALTPAPGQAFAYAHPADVYNLQVQGSGRLQFPDGTQARAAFAAQNGYRWRSAMGALRDQGQLPNATWANFKAWLTQAGPAAARAALAADPSYVFFAEEAIADPAIGPRGAAGVNLTPMGSVAIDPAFHPYGALLFVEATYDGAPFRRLLVAQDTGGAIRRGPSRGDVFFGSGPEAGRRAERMNSPARFWVLTPRPATGAVS